MKTGNVILIAILFLLIGIAVTYWYNSGKTCYDLPEHGTPDQWGNKYWRALHSTVEKIPCSLCRTEGSEMLSFIHDAVNLKLKKPLHNEANFDKYLTKFSEIKYNRSKNA